MKRGSKSGGGGEGENVSLATKGNRNKNVKKVSSSGAKQDNGKQKANEKEMRKVKCFSCGKMSHYVVQCPIKKGKKKQGVAPSMDLDVFMDMFDSSLHWW